MEIKSPPVLTGKAAAEFYKRAAEATESKSKEYVQESMRSTMVFLVEQERLHPSSPWSF